VYAKLQVCAAVTIFATLLTIQTDTHTDKSLTAYMDSLASRAKINR